MIRTMVSAVLLLALAGGAQAGESFVFGRAVASNSAGGSASAAVHASATASSTGGSFKFRGRSSGPGGGVGYFGYGTSTGPAHGFCSASPSGCREHHY